MTSSPEPQDWRETIMRDLPDAPVRATFETFESAYEIIKIAAYNRRMHARDFIGRAALAMAIYDSDGELDWEKLTEKEPPIGDVRLRNVRKRRLRGRGFGPWKIRKVEG